MRFIITAQPGNDSQPPDSNAPFDETLFTAYMTFNEEMHKAGVLVAAEGLHAGGRGARIETRKGRRAGADRGVRYSGERTAVDQGRGPDVERFVSDAGLRKS
jgi:hypothetical protein